MFILPTPTEYFTVKSKQEMDLAPVIAMDLCVTSFFLYFFGMNTAGRGGPDPIDPLHPRILRFFCGSNPTTTRHIPSEDRVLAKNNSNFIQNPLPEMGTMLISKITLF